MNSWSQDALCFILVAYYLIVSIFYVVVAVYFPVMRMACLLG